MTTLRFTVLGSGTPLPDADRGPAGFLIEVDGRAWLVDGGSGTLQRLVRAGVRPRDLAGGVYSHQHPDHCADLVPLLFAFRAGGRETDYPIWAGAGFADFFRRLGDAWGRAMEPRTAKVVLHEHALDGVVTSELGGLVLQTAPANHSACALHLRFEAAGHAIVFSGDTGPSDSLVTLATAASLLVVECGAVSPMAGHLCPDQVVDLVARARPHQVWLTHLHPGVDADALVRAVCATGVPATRVADLDTIHFTG